MFKCSLVLKKKILKKFAKLSLYSSNTVVQNSFRFDEVYFFTENENSKFQF